MKSTLWKLTALTGVMGAGFLVVYLANTNLAQQTLGTGTEQEGDQFQSPEEFDELETPNSEADLGGSDDQAQRLANDIPPQQQGEPELAEQSEPTPAWEPAPDAELAGDSDNPFTSDAAPNRASESQLQQRGAEEPYNPFAGPADSSAAAVADEGLATEQGAASELTFPDVAPPASRPVRTKSEGSSAPKFAAADPFDPFPSSSAESDVSAAEEPAEDPAAADAAEDIQLAGHQDDPFGGDSRSGPLTRLDPQDDGPALITPPPRETTQEEPAGSPDVGFAETAELTTLTEEETDQPPGKAAAHAELSHASNEQSAPQDDAQPPLVLPGAPATSTVPSFDAPPARRNPASFDPQDAGTTPAFDAHPAAGRTQPQAAPRGPDDEVTIHPRSRDASRSDSATDSIFPPSAAVPAQDDVDPFGADPEQKQPAAAEGSLPETSPFGGREPAFQEQTPASDPSFGNSVPTAPADISPPSHPELTREHEATAVPDQPQNLLGVGTVDKDSPLGSQQAQVTIEKEAPPDAVIGKPLIYSIHVRNIGRSLAENVVVKDVTPKGSRLVGTVPQATLDETDGKLIWELGKLSPGELKTIKIKVVPIDAGQIGSVATVSFEAAVAARTIVTAPDLKVTIQGPDEICVGERASYRFTLTNAGSADASGVYIRNLIPEGLEHPRGHDLEYGVGVLRRGESKNVDLTLMAVKPGQFENRAELGADGDVLIEAARTVSILPSRITLHRQGPENRFVGRSARFTNTITNESRETLHEVSIVETVPEGLEFEEASEGGRFDPQRRTVTWLLRQLEPQLPHQVQAKYVPKQAGEQTATIKVFDDHGNAAEVTSQLTVAGFSSLKVDVAHDGAPVPVGEEVALRLTIKNRGTAPASQVRTLIEVPPQMRFVGAKGPLRYRVQGNLVEFEPMPRMEIDAEQQIDIVLAATQRGDARVKVELEAAELSSPLNQEELVVIHPNQE